MDITKIFGNPIMKKMLLKKLSDVIEENGLTLVTIFPDEKGELQFGIYKEPMKVISETDFNNTIQLLSE
jgi:hypothetical protein